MHLIKPQANTLHGQFSKHLTPILTINSGESVVYRTLDVGWGLAQHPTEGNYRKKFEPRDGERNKGPALCGPIAIRQAKSGMFLEIWIEELCPEDWGWTYVGDNGLNSALIAALGLKERPWRVIRWQLDTERMVGKSELGHQVQLNPFLGTVGMPRDTEGWQNGWHPRRTGGNIDCKELIAGSRLYLPIEVEGGLVSIGDGHALQGDGEVAGSAIECCMQKAKLRYVVRDDIAVNQPHAYTPNGWLTFGFDQDLDKAIAQALNGMLQLLKQEYNLERQEALSLASVVVDLRLTQIVNGVRGVHAVLPHHVINYS